MTDEEKKEQDEKHNSIISSLLKLSGVIFLLSFPFMIIGSFFDDNFCSSEIGGCINVGRSLFTKIGAYAFGLTVFGGTTAACAYALYMHHLSGRDDKKMSMFMLLFCWGTILVMAEIVNVRVLGGTSSFR